MKKTQIVFALFIDQNLAKKTKICSTFRSYFNLSAQTSMRRLTSGISTKSHSLTILRVPVNKILLLVSGLKIYSFLRLGVTPNSKSYLDLVIKQNPVLTENIKTTISDDYTVTADLVYKN